MAAGAQQAGSQPWLPASPGCQPALAASQPAGLLLRRLRRTLSSPTRPSRLVTLAVLVGPAISTPPSWLSMSSDWPWKSVTSGSWPAKAVMPGMSV
jgi:hypothetical protein